jgi:hypothetical protein
MGFTAEAAESRCRRTSTRWSEAPDGSTLRPRRVHHATTPHACNTGGSDLRA